MLRTSIVRTATAILTTVARLLLVALLISIVTTHTVAAAPASDPNELINRVLARTNMYRAQFGCPTLTLSPQLTASAQAHSDDMAGHNFFAHNGSDGSTAFDRMHAVGYQFRLAAENIAAGYDTPEDVVDGWFNEVAPDDGHRLNILNCNLHEMGVGYTYLSTTDYQSYWTQDFGTTRS